MKILTPVRISMRDDACSEMVQCLGGDLGSPPAGRSASSKLWIDLLLRGVVTVSRGFFYHIVPTMHSIRQHTGDSPGVNVNYPEQIPHRVT